MELVAGFVLILLSGLFSGSETAAYRAQWIRLTTWAGRKVGGASTALRLLQRRESTVIATLVGTNLCSVFAAMLTSEYVAIRFGAGYTVIAVVAVVALNLVLGEFLPKAHAQARPNRWLRRAAYPVGVSLILFLPAVLLLEGIARLFATPFAATRARLSLTRHDLLAAFRQRERRPADANGAACEPGQSISSMVARLFRLSGMRVGEAEIPLEQVVSVREGAGVDEIRRVIEENGFSRIPVRRGDDPADIVGVILAKDLLAGPTFRVREIERVPGDARAMEVLERMQRRGLHIALVTGARGRVDGIVTLEDILEELVGEIRDEG